MHGLTDRGRYAYVREVSALALPGATLLLAGFSERDRRGPRGFDRPELERRFASEWDLLSSRQDTAVSNRPDDPIYVHELRRRERPSVLLMACQVAGPWLSGLRMDIQASGLANGLNPKRA